MTTTAMDTKDAEEQTLPAKADTTTQTSLPSRSQPSSFKPGRQIKVALFICTMVAIFGYMGAGFGWGHLQLLLEDAGAFSSRCTSEERAEKIICPEQAATLVSIPFYAQLVEITSPLLGHISDHYGPKTLALCMTVTIWTGLSLWLIAIQEEVFELLYPGFILFSFATMMGSLLMIPVGSVFHDQKTTSRIVFVLNNAFDAGSITFLIMWGIREVTGWSLMVLMGGYTGFAVLLFGTITYLWFIVSNDDAITTKKAPPMHDNEATSITIKTAEPSDGTLLVASTTTTPTASAKELGVAVEDGGLKQRNHDANDEREEEEKEEEEQEEEQQQKEDNEEPAKETYVAVCDRTPRQQLMSGPFLLLMGFFTIHVLGNRWILVTTREFLAFLGDDELNNRYLFIFTILAPASLVAVPIMYTIVNIFGYSGGFQMINVFAMIHFLIRILSTDLNAQIVGFLFFSLFRSMFFGITLSSVPIILGLNVVGKASGILFAVSGVLSFINIPLADYAVQQQGGDFFIPDMFHTILIIPCIVLAFFLGRAVSREEAARNE